MTPPPASDAHVCVNGETIIQMRVDVAEIREQTKNTALMLQSTLAELRSHRLELSRLIQDQDSRIRDMERNKADCRDIDRLSEQIDNVQTASDQRTGRESLTTIGIAAFISGVVAFFIRLMSGGGN